jgi:hypothetical protein
MRLQGKYLGCGDAGKLGKISCNIGQHGEDNWITHRGRWKWNDWICMEKASDYLQQGRCISGRMNR